MSIMIILSIVISVAIILGTFYLNKFSSASSVEKFSQYECGFEPVEEIPGIETREKFYIKYYIIGIIFLIFDLEAILLYPFTTTTLINMGVNVITPYCVFIVFMFILAWGLAYEYKKGVLN